VSVCRRAYRRRTSWFRKRGVRRVAHEEAGLGRPATDLPPEQDSQELRRHVTDHQGLGHAARRARPLRPQPPPGDACQLWAFASLTASPGARAFYDQRRATGDTHHRALRALANRLVGILHGCLRYGVIYDEDTAWAHRIEQAA
jgi:hypothetical protein